MAIGGPLEIDSTARGGRATLTLRGELDIATLPRMTEAVDAALSERPSELRIDLRPLSFVDSSGLRELVALAERARCEGWSLALVRPAKPALAVFQVTRAEESLPFVEDAGSGAAVPQSPPAARAAGSLRLELERTVRAPAIARSAVAERLVAAGIDGSVGQTVVLLVSEVVSNAVRHSVAPVEEPISLEAHVTDSCVRIAVTDAGRGFTPRPRDPDRLGDGYGLYLLDKAATRWGVQSGEGTTVWFEVGRAGG